MRVVRFDHQVGHGHGHGVYDDPANQAQAPSLHRAMAPIRYTVSPVIASSPHLRTCCSSCPAAGLQTEPAW